MRLPQNLLDALKLKAQAKGITQHALTRMAERGISRDEVLATIANPIRMLKAENERFEAQGWINRATKRQLLRVIYGVLP